MSSTVILYEIPIPIAPLPSRFFMPLCPLYGKAIFSLRWVCAMSWKPSWKEESLDRLLGHMRRLRVITPELLTEVIAVRAFALPHIGARPKRESINLPSRVRG